MRDHKKKVNILGTEYSIKYTTKELDTGLEGADGYVSVYRKSIVVDLLEQWDDSERESRCKEVLRHEIIHAFLMESGLAWSSNTAEQWAQNEEMVDWFAMQFPKILVAFEEVGCL